MQPQRSNLIRITHQNNNLIWSGAPAKASETCLIFVGLLNNAFFLDHGKLEEGILNGLRRQSPGMIRRLKSMDIDVAGLET